MSALIGPHSETTGLETCTRNSKKCGVKNIESQAITLNGGEGNAGEERGKGTPEKGMGRERRRREVEQHRGEVGGRGGGYSRKGRMVTILTYCWNFSNSNPNNISNQ